MSRCFPFPPPGYEKKTSTDDADLLKKEKHKVKKHKKEKRDKEKSDSKDKREKDRSEGKDREKNDKKEKHRDKKKDKEKDVDKNVFKSSAADEKKLAGKPKGHNGEILGRIGKTSYSNEKNFSGKFVGDTEKINQNNYHLVEDTKHSKFVQELDRRISVGGNGAMDHSATQKFMGIDPKMDEAVLRVVTKDFGNGAERKDRKMDGHGSRDVPEPNENTKIYNLPGFVQGKFEGTPGPSDKNVKKKMEGKDKTKKKESDDKREDKDKEKKSKSKNKSSEQEKKSKSKDKSSEQEKKSKSKDKSSEQEKKSKTKDKNGEKEEKKEVKDEAKITEKDKFKEGDKKGHIGIYSSTMPVISMDNDMAAAIQGNHRKRKDLWENGFFHDTGEAPEVPDGLVNPQLPSDPDISLNKLAHPVSSHSSLPLVENGRVLEPWTPPDRKGMSINHIVHNKKQKVSSIIEGQPVSLSPGKPSPTTSKPKKISMHPDSKYLDQILTVPKMEEWSDFDDQEWLLSSNKTLLKKPKVGDFSVNETPQVWDKAMLIDSADICALPYVIPY